MPSMKASPSIDCQRVAHLELVQFRLLKEPEDELALSFIPIVICTDLSHKGVVSGVVTGLDMCLDQPVQAPLDQGQGVVPLCCTDVGITELHHREGQVRHGPGQGMGALQVVWDDWLMGWVEVGWKQQETAGASEERVPSLMDHNVAVSILPWM